MRYVSSLLEKAPEEDHPALICIFHTVQRKDYGGNMVGWKWQSQNSGHIRCKLMAST